MTETNLQSTRRLLGEAEARIRAEMLANPQQAAMLKAMEPTKAELEELAAADEAVAQAEASIGSATQALVRAERGQKPSYDRQRPFSFFEKSPERHKAVADAAVPGLKIDAEEARSQLQSAIRRRNETVQRIAAARMERRRAAKLRLAMLPTVRSRNAESRRGAA